ncbi:MULTISPECIES: glycosyltransferase family 4 protein [unclassified Serratia (in: enterobacteria)]|uniref:glycosyltransferase family 4 protein n=1 Tax=unclassified Serratia (in: enterobacteria) TaxID=2647522 RepID=UPI002ED29508|nr:glycosyltransferase family 4 protein [Serratia sp. C2(2)]MEE4447380.1 glycosyltransferase family 4 protein [Serratia sp. C2(1)]
MKIVLINTLYAPYKIGGAEVSVQMLAESLQSAGHQVRVFCLHEGDEIKHDVLNGVGIVYFPLKNLYWPFQKQAAGKLQKAAWHLLDSYNPFMTRMVRNELRAFAPDVVHTNNLSGFSVAIWRAAKKLGARVVHTTRDYYLFHPNGTLFQHGQNMDVKGRTVAITSYFKKKASQNVDAFVGISKYISALHQENGFARNAQHTYIYNPVAAVDFAPIPSEKVRIGFVGRLTEDKGFDEFCSLAKQGLQDPDVEFYAAGRFNNDASGEQMKALAETSGVKLLGFIKIEEFMAQVDAVVLPTRWNEPFGRAVAESAISGKVVYTTFSGGVTEIAAYYDNIFELTDFSIAGVIGAVKENKNSLRRSFFEIEKIASSYESVYRG